jgi:hypothetical protein
VSAARVTFLASPAPGGELEEVTGTAARIESVRVVVHRASPRDWRVSEPTTGHAIAVGGADAADALRIARARVELYGGAGALLHAMSHAGATRCVLAATTGGTRPTERHLHSAGLAYLAGGPLDAPDHIAAGYCRYRYGTPEAVTVCRPGWLS